jgi:multiple sugar transport system substrate-binding protein
MTWSHPRGYDPMVACSALWRQQTGVDVQWDKRSLQDFESFPVEELARSYDLIVIDHPHVGQITAEGCLAPLDRPGREAELAALARHSVGASYRSYTWEGRQWAFPIDAATQVQVWQPERIGRAPASWREIVDLARDGAVLLPLRVPHSLMSFYTLTANLGGPCREQEISAFIDPVAGAQAYDLLLELSALIGPASFEMDPIAVFEAMATPDSRIACAPLIYGYVSYALAGFRPARLAFADIPVVGSGGPVGSALGGTGLAVSARSSDVQAAVDFAYWVASAEVQRGPYAQAGGQPGHATAWEDAAVNAPVQDFYTATRATLEGAWVRPRHNGYMPFQQAASERLNRGLLAREGSASVIADLNRAYETSVRERN